MRQPQRSVLHAVMLMILAGCHNSPPAGSREDARQEERIPTELVADIRRQADRGIGLMGQFNFSAAAEAFATARRLDPRSRTLRINHAIALLNTATEANLDEARELLQNVLLESADDPHAHFCLGIIALHRNQLDEARPHFDAVTRIDPSDPSGWYHLGLTQPPGSDAATACFEKALSLNPNLSAAMHGLAMNLRRTDPARARALLSDQQALLGAEWDEPLRIRYAEMGRYGEVIVDGLAVGIQITPQRIAPPLADQTPSFGVPRQVYAFEPGPSDDAAAAVQLAHTRFGSVILPLLRQDSAGVDLLVLDRGRLVLLALSPDGEAENMTPRHPDLAALDDAATAVAAAVGDFDNDGRPDLAISTVDPTTGIRLLRNDPATGFTDITATVLGDTAGNASLAPAWIDLDQDGDLDLIVARTAASGGTTVYLNVSVAPPTVPNQAPPPLAVAFREAVMEGLSGIPAATVLVSDLDDDRDLDLMLLGEGIPQVIWNDRLLRFRHESLPAVMETEPGEAIGSAEAGLSFDLEADGLFERLLLRRDATPLLETCRGVAPFAGLPVLRQAATADMDLDGRPDLIGLDESSSLCLALNRQSMLVPNEIKELTDEPLVAICPVDIDRDAVVDLVALSRAGDLVWQKNLLVGRHALQITASGRRDRATSLRTNADGVGVRAVALAGQILASCENTTLTAGLGQHRMPIHLGIGAATQADVVRLVWPDGVPQAELDVPSDRLVRIEETSRKTTSCPVLFVWNGSAFGFVTDFLGGGVTGETLADGSVRPPRPEETVAIRPAPVVRDEDGVPTVRLLITEPFDEVLYLDAVRLVACDHPTDWAVIPDERFPGAGPAPTGDLLVVGPAVTVSRAVTDSGEDVTDLLTAADGRMTAPRQPRSWLGYAEPHSIDLDFRGRLDNLHAAPIVFEADGWTDYPYPESMWAAAQAGIDLQPPRLLSIGASDSPPRACEIGFFAGLPRVMGRILDADFLGHDAGVFRLATSMQIGWDRIALRPLLQRFAVGSGATRFVRDGLSPEVRRHTLPLRAARLRYAGLARELAVGDRGLVAYDATRRDPLPTTRWEGNFSTAGSVLSDLVGQDHVLTICGPGHDIECHFDAAGLPGLPAGWARSWFLEATGYTRDTSPLTAGGGRVSPLPTEGQEQSR